jgi:branched-chain amino acid transport system permease protein
MLIQLIINSIVKGAMIALAGLGFALYYNTTRIFHIAYAAIYTLSAYLFYSYFSLFSRHWLPAFFLTAVSVILVSILIELAVYRPLSRKGSSLMVVLVASIGLMTVIINSIAIIYGNEVKILYPGVAKSVSIGALNITYPQLRQFFVCLLVIGVTLVFLKATKWGKIIRAIRDGEKLAMASGINVWGMRLTLIAASSFIIAIPSVLTAADVGMDPHGGMQILLSAIVALIIGGVGRFEGPVIGGFFLALIHGLVIWKFSGKWVDAVTFVILIIFLIFRPNGILGERHREV